MLTSSVPLVKAALEARIAAVLAAAGHSALVSRGHPYPKAWAGQTVIVGRVAGRLPPVWTAAMTQQNEEYEIEVLVNVAGSAQDAYSSFEDAAYALEALIAGDLVAWTREPETLPAGDWGQVLAILPAGGSDEEGIEEDRHGAPKSRDATVTLTVHVRARLVGHG